MLVDSKLVVVGGKMVVVMDDRVVFDEAVVEV